jgi:hypothetical protein
LPLSKRIRSNFLNVVANPNRKCDFLDANGVVICTAPLLLRFQMRATLPIDCPMGIRPRTLLLIYVKHATALALMIVPTLLANASTLWTGPTTNYVQTAPDPAQAANQDRLTPQDWLTRSTTEGLFNAVDESSYDRGPDTDPTDTEWSYGALSNYSTLTYTTWAEMSTNNPPSMVGREAVVHLISDDIYVSITFTFWGSSGGGGFAYDRSTPAVVAVPPTITNATVNAGQFAFDYTASSGLSYLVQKSSNLMNWLPVATNVASSNLVYFTASLATNSPGYFRVGLLPNP